MKTKLFYGIFIVLSMWGLYSCKQAEKPIKFAIVSDLHAPDLPDGRERMQAVVDAANAENVDFLIQLGDFIRLDSVSQPLQKVWDQYKGEKYHVLGNHDLDKYSKEEFVAGTASTRSDACTGQPPLTFWQPAESSRSRAPAVKNMRIFA